MLFEDFMIGDHVWFEKTFAQEDFNLFSALSGDRNALHHNVTKAEENTFGQNIVPMHMVAAPLSRVAGMVFPGEPSLYLGTQWRMPHPAYFGVPTLYSARIRAISAAQRLLEIRTIAVQRGTVVFDATQHVTARHESWETPSELGIRRSDDAKRVILTGAGGEIGRAVAIRLASAGHPLLLVARDAGPRLETLKRDCEKHGVDAQILIADLASERGRTAMVTSLQSVDDAAALVHAASPGIQAPVGDLVAVNFTALEAMSSALVGRMLRCQAGTILFIGSAAVETHPQGWAAYAGAKAMATSYVQGIDATFGKYGIHGRVLAPGYVRTAMSKDVRPAGVDALLPEEVAHQVALILAKPDDAAPYLSMRPDDLQGGRFGFVRRAAEALMPAAETASSSAAPAAAGRPKSVSSEDGDLLGFVAAFLGSSDIVAVRDGGIDMTAGWDSLRHIELMLAVEQDLGLRFTATEIEQAKTYRGLEKLVRGKTSA